MLSHVEAAAVTDDVSFTAVPAKIPNASPLVVSNLTSFPKIGKMSAASTLKKKMTEKKRGGVIPPLSFYPLYNKI